MQVLLLHGNGGSRTRFLPMLAHLQQTHPDVSVRIPELQGFDGRPLQRPQTDWDDFLNDLSHSLPDDTSDWVFYGHGIGGSLLMELAARGFTFPDGKQARPRRVILHSVIGASLHKRLFPQLMQPKWVRGILRKLIAAPLLQPLWERKLFLYPDRIPPELRRQFFADYAQCDAFGVFFDLITVAWYRRVRAEIQDYPFHFLWGKKERVVQAKYLALWQADFPQASVEIMPDWDHFPMLEQVEDFTAKLVNLVSA